MPVFECRTCRSALVRRAISKTGFYYCNLECKAAFQRTQRPVTEEWLRVKYLDEQLDCTQIAKIVNRNSKRVWEWLVDCGIETRKRGYASSATWVRKGSTSMFKGRKHTEKTRRLLSEISKADGRVPFNKKIGPPLKGKRGAEVPTWKGGITPQRQAFYSSNEWKSAVRKVWIRDAATCQRCGIKKTDNKSLDFDIHHIVGFACVELRATLSNLVLLCEPCHYWVHSSANINGLFILEKPVEK